MTSRQNVKRQDEDTRQNNRKCKKGIKRQDNKGRKSASIDVMDIKEEDESNTGIIDTVALKSSTKTYCAEKQNICYHCKEGFSHPTELYKHTLLYKCSVCPQCFCQLSFLQDHMTSHSADNETSAASDKRPSAPCESEQDMGIQNETKPYKCSLCGKGFLTLSSLETHMNVHLRGSHGY